MFLASIDIVRSFWVDRESCDDDTSCEKIFEYLDVEGVLMIFLEAPDFLLGLGVLFLGVLIVTRLGVVFLF